MFTCRKERNRRSDGNHTSGARDGQWARALGWMNTGLGRGTWVTATPRPPLHLGSARDSVTAPRPSAQGLTTRGADATTEDVLRRFATRRSLRWLLSARGEDHPAGVRDLNCLDRASVIAWGGPECKAAGRSPSSPFRRMNADDNFVAQPFRTTTQREDDE